MKKLYSLQDTSFFPKNMNISYISIIVSNNLDTNAWKNYLQLSFHLFLDFNKFAPIVGEWPKYTINQHELVSYAEKQNELSRENEPYFQKSAPRDANENSGIRK